MSTSAPTSRSAFRLLVRDLGVTNREADDLRHALLSLWEERAGVSELEGRLRSLDPSDAAATSDVGAGVAIWFSFDGGTIAADHPVLAGVSPGVRDHLARVGLLPPS